MNRTAIASLPLVALSAVADADGAAPVIQIVPDGVFAARDGRPGTLGKGYPRAWKLTPEIAATVIDRWRRRRTALVIDYEHQTLHAPQNGRPAPAAGWIETLRYEPGKGLRAEVRWTAAAAAHIRADEYRYISPVIAFDPRSGAVLEVRGAALTNFPALDGMDAVAARELLTEEHMDFEPRVKTLLGLPADADAAALNAALDELEAALPVADGKPVALAAHLSALRERAGQPPDPRRYTPAAVLAAVQEQNKALAERLEALVEEQRSARLESAVQAALADGRLPGAAEAWARELGEKAPDMLDAYLRTAKPLAALQGTQTAGRTPPDAAALTEEDRYACAALGLSPDEFAQAKKEGL